MSLPPLLALFVMGCSQAFDPNKPGDPVGTDDTGGTTEPTDSDVTEAVTLSFTSPEAESSNPLTLEVEVTGTVRRVEYFVGDLPVGDSVEPASGFSVSYRSDVLGPVGFTARAFDGLGIELASASATTRVIDMGAENTLGVWIGEREDTGSTHEELAVRLGALGVKRVFVKVGHGSTTCSTWPDACDPAVPAAYHAQGIEAWAWTYPAPSNPAGGLVAVTYTAEAGYDAFVLQLGPEWSEEPAGLEEALEVYASNVESSVRLGRAPSTFQLYTAPEATGLEDGLRLDLLDDWSAGILPLLRAEQLGTEATEDPAGAISDVTCAWRDAGVDAPIFPVLATLEGVLTPLAVNDFIDVGGAQSSVWQVPEAKDPNGIWSTWSAVNWTAGGLANSAECR